MPSDRANIIKKEMLPAFLSDLDSHKVTKEYWDECKMARNAFTPDDIHKMQTIFYKGIMPSETGFRFSSGL